MATPMPRHQRYWTGTYLSDLQQPKVIVRCEQCNIRRQYDASRLLASLDEDMNLSMLLDRMRVALACQTHAAHNHIFDPICGLAYDSVAMGR